MYSHLQQSTEGLSLAHVAEQLGVEELNPEPAVLSLRVGRHLVAMALGAAVLAPHPVVRGRTKGSGPSARHREDGFPQRMGVMVASMAQTKSPHPQLQAMVKAMEQARSQGIEQMAPWYRYRTWQRTP